jgi:hypothetical protein
LILRRPSKPKGAGHCAGLLLFEVKGGFIQIAVLCVIGRQGMAFIPLSRQFFGHICFRLRSCEDIRQAIRPVDIPEYYPLLQIGHSTWL